MGYEMDYEMDYEMEELLPLVAELAHSCCGYESTSVTYERAQTFMGAVLYCLQEYRNTGENSLVSKHISVREQYDIGVRLVREKVEHIRKEWNELSLDFECYGVKCLRDTVQKEIPKFLKWYDIKYNPQETVASLDYPLLKDCSSLSGADAVYQYLLELRAEQRILGQFGREYVRSVLESYHPQYAHMVENICEIVLADRKRIV